MSPHYGRSDRIRTCGILLPKQARYQLRYTPIFYFAFFLKFSVFPCFVRPLAKLSPMAPLCNAMRSVLLRFLKLPASATGSGRLRHPKQARYQLRYTPIFLFCFFHKIFRISLLCPPAIRLAQADHGTCVILIYPAGFVKRVIGRATVAAPSALMHTQRKIPPLWLTPGRWYSLGAKISPGTAGWTGNGHRYPAARLRWSCLRSPGAWPAARRPKRLRRS